MPMPDSAKILALPMLKLRDSSKEKDELKN